jgi:ribose transport system ATP-binding protein
MTKSFPGVLALRDVDFEVRRGEVHVLAGENGAGKSTLMKVITGAYPKDSGMVWLDGSPVEIDNPRRGLDLGISMIYQEFNLARHRSVAHNIFLGREPLTRWGFIDHRRLYRDTEEALARLHLRVSPRTPVRRLGVAQQQMVEIAKALSAEAKIIIMDEPTAALTDHEIQELFRTIRELKALGISVIYISHRLEEIFEIGDRLTILRDGRRIATVPVTQTTIPEVIRMMVGRELGEMFPKKSADRGAEVLRVERLTRRHYVSDVTFALHRGEIVGFAGLIGSGRTELMNAVFGADPILAGRIFVHGEPVSIRSPVDAIRAGIGYLTEDRKGNGLALSLTVVDNIALPNLDRLSRLGFIDFSTRQRVSREWAGRLQIKTPSLRRKVAFLSGGNQQKVVLAKWLCRHCDVLIFDEPTRGIDVGAKVEVYRLMNALIHEGKAIVMISSYLPELIAMCDRILVMRDGRLTGEVAGREATQERIMTLATGGHALEGVS